jgi:hypothetical protein
MESIAGHGKMRIENYIIISIIAIRFNDDNLIDKFKNQINTIMNLTEHPRHISLGNYVFAYNAIVIPFKTQLISYHQSFEMQF